MLPGVAAAGRSPGPLGKPGLGLALWPSQWLACPSKERGDVTECKGPGGPEGPCPEEGTVAVSGASSRKEAWEPLQGSFWGPVTRRAVSAPGGCLGWTPTDATALLTHRETTHT